MKVKQLHQNRKRLESRLHYRDNGSDTARRYSAAIAGRGCTAAM